jgi:hypothetical protein
MWCTGQPFCYEKAAVRSFVFVGVNVAVDNTDRIFSAPYYVVIFDLSGITIFSHIIRRQILEKKTGSLNIKMCLFLLFQIVYKLH